VNALRNRILSDGRNLGRGILKVDSFLNHQVDPMLIDECGRELAARFHAVDATKVLTAEISGIAPAVTTALHLRVPLVYARRSRPVTMPDQVLLTVAPSHTRGQMIELIETGDVPAARKIHEELSPLFNALFVTSNPIPLKAALQMVGRSAGEPRLPLVPATAEERDRVRKALEDAGLV